MIDAITPLVEAGFSIIWLHPREKRPIGDDWSKKPVWTLDQLRANYRDGNNVGVRLGEPSCVAGHYLHVIDLDIRVPAMTAEAKAALAGFLPEYDTLPFVISGSGGESRHFYFLTERAFRSKKLAHSTEKFTDAKGKEHWAWEVELFGTGKQVAAPPSIHPDTGLAYVWGREIDLFDLLLGVGPFVGEKRVAEWAPDATPVGDDEDEEFGALVRARPKDLSDREIAETLAALPTKDWCDDRDGWLTVGMALHHQFEGRPEGLKVWNAFSAQSKKYDEKDQARVWKSFDGNRRPTTMATLLQAAKEARFKDGGDFGDDVDLAEDDDDDDLGLGRDPEVDALLGIEETRPALDWVSLLDLNDEGAIKATLHNTELMVRNDVRTANLAAFNQFTQEVMFRGKPGVLVLPGRKRAKKAKQLTSPVWTMTKPVSGDLWVDEHDYGVRNLFEAPRSQGGYGVKVSDRDLRAALNITAHGRAFHPVREYLVSVTWDGVPRIDTMFTRYLGADESAYTRSISRLTVLGAVVRAHEPGHKFDFVPILEGLQGKRKSTFIDILARHWFAEIEGNFEDRKAMVEKMQGAWILELPELQGFGRHEVSIIKAFVSARVDKVRLAYAHRARNYDRQCIFIGSTNDSTYLRDDTGGRRFWPIACTVDEIDTDAFTGEVDQIWAEAKHVYLEMRARQPFGTLPLYIQDDIAKADALSRQEDRRVINVDDEMASRIAEWLEKVTNDEGDDLMGDEPPRLRDEVCSMCVWCEMLGRDLSQYGQVQQQSIGRALKKVPGWAMAGQRRFDRYGKQRAFVRVSSILGE